MNVLWDVPNNEQPSFVAARVRALLLLALLGGGVLAATVLSGEGTAAGRFGIAFRVGVIIASLVVDFLLFWVAFRVLTAADVSWTALRGGAAAAALAYEVLQLAGSYYVSHTLKNASNVYGTFAFVIGLLSWIYLTATILLLAAEGNVVAARKLWPRSLRKPAAGSSEAKAGTTRQ
jgi:membrane protein